MRERIAFPVGDAIPPGAGLLDEGEGLANAMEGCQVVFHLAAITSMTLGAIRELIPRLEAAAARGEILGEIVVVPVAVTAAIVTAVASRSVTSAPASEPTERSRS